MRKVPNMPVLMWYIFLTNAFIASTTLDTCNCIFKRPDIIVGALSVEESIVDMFLKIMKDINNKRLILLQKQSWGKGYMFEGVKGQPDVIHCVANNSRSYT
ncbi:hypothetical protein Glove_372g85 [Diversispora epigaea]|uniref:Uncharacterized protein n=1 Tax=Diversispora epigaea TaxID=1348612 RepID=A0A397H6Q1_9GLOM|nr:hypothetical protein Glove_372g85 [Diversispora epigaea]